MISSENIISMSGPSAVEYEEYFEEEILSYEDGLSTILEGENESCTSRNDDYISVVDALNSPGRRSSAQIPENISWTPEVNSSLRKLSMEESPGFAMLSPLLSHDSRKISSLKSPLLSARKYMRSPGRPSPNSPGRLSPNSPGLPKPPLTFTSFTTGEEIVVEDDDEYTFVSCSDAESLMGASLTNFDAPFTNFDAPFTNFEEDSFPSSASDLSVASSGSKVSSGSSSAKSVKSAKSVSSMPLDFESTRRQLQNALESRRKRGKMGVEGMDYFRRKLRLDLSRRMIDEQLSSCMHIPAEG
jgi:hypothetical protein